MAHFMVEAYVARTTAAEMPGAAARLRAAAQELSAAGVPVRYVRSTLVPEDETCFHIFEASSREAVGQAVALAGLQASRIVEAFE